MFDLLGAVWLNDHQLEAHPGWGGTSFAPDETALSLVEPNHVAVETVLRGELSLA